MYEAPIKVIMGQMRSTVDGQIYKAVQDIGVDVDKDELVRALQYDRDQYDKGYYDGRVAAAKEISNGLAKCVYRLINDAGYTAGDLSYDLEQLKKKYIGE